MLSVCGRCIMRWIYLYFKYCTISNHFPQEPRQKSAAHQNNASVQWTAFHFETTWSRSHSVNSSMCYYTMDIGLYCSHFITKVILERSYFHSLIPETHYSIPYIFQLPSTDGNAVVWLVKFPCEVAWVGYYSGQDGDHRGPKCRECRNILCNICEHIMRVMVQKLGSSWTEH